MLLGQIELKLDAKDEAVITAHVTALESRAAKAEAEAAAAVANGEALKAKLDAACSPAAVQAAVSARVALETVARKVLGSDVDLTAKTDSELRSDVVAKALPALKLDGKSEAEILCYFDVAAVQAPEAPAAKVDAAKEKLREVAAGTRTDGKDPVSPAAAREEMINKRRAMGTAKL
jgi:hypothetical protein